MSGAAGAGALEFERVRPDVRLDIYRGEEWITAFAQDVRDGLTSDPPWLHPKYFYDATGSQLFDRICELPEYYPTRTEDAILRESADRIIERSDARCLVELGSGSSRKTEHLLTPLLARNDETLYVPIDFSESAVREAAVRLVSEHSGLRVHGVIGDFEKHLGGLPEAEGRLIAFLGGTIGNFVPARRAIFLQRLALLLETGDSLLVGVDLVKDRERLEAAYNDSAGVTAAFNRNVLASINRNLGADFDSAAWDHIAFFDQRNSWIEMRLQASRAQAVSIGAIDLDLNYEPGDQIRTEISCKFTRAGLGAELSDAGLELIDWYSDGDEMFALALVQRADS